MHNSRLQNALKALLLLALGFFLYSRIANGSLYFYISQRFMVLILMAVLGLIVVGISYQFATDHSHGEHDCCHDEGHGHGHSHSLTWSAALILALPILLGLLVPPQPLGASALSNREMETGGERSRMPATVRNAQAKADVDKNILDWAYEFDADAPEAIVGKEADVIGFVFHDAAGRDTADGDAQNENADSFLLARYVVSCCVADAAYVGLTVRWPESTALEQDQWVRVRGQLDTQQVDGITRPILIADEVEPADMPSQPYLYP